MPALQSVSLPEATLRTYTGPMGQPTRLGEAKLPTGNLADPWDRLVQSYHKQRLIWRQREAN